MSNGADNTSSLGLNIISFLIPFLGLFFFKTYENSAPARAASIRMFTILGFVVWLVVGVVFTQFVQ